MKDLSRLARGRASSLFRRLRHAAAAAALLAASLPAAAAVEWGTTVPADRDSRLAVSWGAVSSVSGRVDETFRAYYHATGQDSKQSLAESWDFDDFGFDAPWQTFGLRFEHAWRFASFRFDLSLFELDASARARRDYYIGLEDDISYGGREYGHLKIPAGSGFSSEFSGGLASALVAVTPLTLTLGENVKLVPEADLGLVAVAGDWKIDAGPARGTAVYQNPPVEFVVGGSASSFIGAGAPFFGLGAELCVGPDDWVQWTTRANGGFFSYSGSTKPFTSSSHREKDLDLDFMMISLDTSVVLPMDERTCFVVGARFQFLSLEGSIKSKPKDRSAVVAARERFDKEAEADLTLVQVYAGITF